MDFIDRIKAISQQVLKLKDRIENEQATKAAFIMPFLQTLGYNVFSPLEIAHEFTADVPGLRGEKVDYAIMMEDKPVILIECKSCNESLEHPKHNSQLHRYFHVTAAKFGILTNGIIYRFYTDIEKINVMDTKPFFEFNLLNFEELAVNELKRFTKTSFNSSELEDIAKNLLYAKEIKRIMAEQLTNPSPEFVKFFANQIYSGRMMTSVVDKFTEITKKSLKEFINESITEKFKSVIDSTQSISSLTNNNDDENIEINEKNVKENEIITTEEELEGFYVVKSILREVIDTHRIQYKDTKAYFGINLDSKVTKTICRLYFNQSKKAIGIIDAEGKEAKTNLSNIDEIYSLAAILKDRAKSLSKEKLVDRSI